VTFNERLTAIGGEWTQFGRSTKMIRLNWMVPHSRSVEVYADGSWNHRTIPPVGNKAQGILQDFTSLAVEHQLYVFGNISQFFFVKIKLFLITVDAIVAIRFPQFGRLRKIQMANGKRTHHYDGQCITTVRT